MKKENVVKKTFYLDEDLSSLLDSEKVRTGKSISEIISLSLDRYFKSNILEGATTLQGPLDDKVEQLNSLTLQIKKTNEALYRNLSYLVSLMNIGAIANDGTVKFNSASKQVARKKALKNYQMLKAGELTIEEYLMENEDSLNMLASGEPPVSPKEDIVKSPSPSPLITTEQDKPKHEEKLTNFSSWFGN